MDKKIDLETTASEHRGIKGLFESALRRFKILSHLGTMIPVYIAGCLILGLCLVPGIYFYHWMSDLTAHAPVLVQHFGTAFSLPFGFCLYGFSMIFTVPTINLLLNAKLKPWRGPYYSAESFKWYLHNALTYLLRFTFLEFVTPSPISLMFYRMMGMKIGRGSALNTTWISDPSLIEIGDKVTVGGSVTIVAHYGQGGLLVIAPVKIGHGVTVGLKATIMGGVTIGDGAKIMPHSVVMPKTEIPAGELWGGVPAVHIQHPKSSAA